MKTIMKWGKQGKTGKIGLFLLLPLLLLFHQSKIKNCKSFLKH